MSKIQCPLCKGVKLSSLEWVDANTNEPTGEESPMGADGEYHCDNCEENVIPVQISDTYYFKLKTENKNKN
jgi:hypothetical protein